MRKLLWIILGTFLVFQSRCAKPPAAQQACGFVQNSDGQRVSWKGLLPIKLYYDASVPPVYYDAIQNAVNTWQQAIGRQIFIIAGTLPPSQPAQDGKSVIYWLNSWANDPTSASQQANTTIYWVDNQITEADMKINAADFTMSENPSPSQVDIQSLVLHELGHVMGLKHTDDVPSVMNASLQSGYDRRSLYSVDTSDIKCEY